MPVVGVRNMFDYRILRTFSIRFFDFTAPFPVIYAQCSVIFVSKNHINRTGNAQFFVKYGPFCPIRLQIRIILYKLPKILVLDALVIARTLVIIALDIIMHRCSGCRRFVATLVPPCLNLVRRLSIIFAFSPFFGARH